MKRLGLSFFACLSLSHCNSLESDFESSVKPRLPRITGWYRGTCQRADNQNLYPSLLVVEQFTKGKDLVFIYKGAILSEVGSDRALSQLNSYSVSQKILDLVTNAMKDSSEIQESAQGFYYVTKSSEMKTELRFSENHQALLAAQSPLESIDKIVGTCFFPLKQKL